MAAVLPLRLAPGWVPRAYDSTGVVLLRRPFEIDRLIRVASAGRSSPASLRDRRSRSLRGHTDLRVPAPGHGSHRARAGSPRAPPAPCARGPSSAGRGLDADGHGGGDLRTDPTHRRRVVVDVPPVGGLGSSRAATALGAARLPRRRRSLLLSGRPRSTKRCPAARRDRGMVRPVGHQPRTGPGRHRVARRRTPAAGVRAAASWPPEPSRLNADGSPTSSSARWATSSKVSSLKACGRASSWRQIRHPPSTSSGCSSDRSRRTLSNTRRLLRRYTMPARAELETAGSAPAGRGHRRHPRDPRACASRNA